MSDWSPVIYFSILADRFASRDVVLLLLLDTHDIAQLGAGQFPVFVLCLKTLLFPLFHMKVKNQSLVLNVFTDHNLLRVQHTAELTEHLSRCFTSLTVVYRGNVIN